MIICLKDKYASTQIRNSLPGCYRVDFCKGVSPVNIRARDFEQITGDVEMIYEYMWKILSILFEQSEQIPSKEVCSLLYRNHLK